MIPGWDPAVNRELQIRILPSELRAHRPFSEGRHPMAIPGWEERTRLFHGTGVGFSTLAPSSSAEATGAILDCLGLPS